MLPAKTNAIGSTPSSPIKPKEGSPIKTFPLSSPVLLVNDGRENDNAVEYFFHSLFYSRKIANKIVLALALGQIFFLGTLSWKVAQIHLIEMYETSRSSNSFAEYLLKMIPGLVVLPILVGMVVWPSFLVFGSFKAHSHQDLDTVERHLIYLRRLQASFYSYLIERIHKKEVRYVLRPWLCFLLFSFLSLH
jgi:hypothetical protein